MSGIYATLMRDGESGGYIWFGVGAATREAAMAATSVVGMRQQEGAEEVDDASGFASE